MPDQTVTITLRQQQDYQFRAEFGDAIPALLCDLPAPLGQAGGPSPEHLLAAAVGNCLSSSLLFALRKFKQDPAPMAAEIQIDVGRNDQNRVRVLGLRATLTLGVPAAALEHLDRVLATFEEYCTVTQSVRQGIPVEVQVLDATGARLK